MQVYYRHVLVFLTEFLPQTRQTLAAKNGFPPVVALWFASLTADAHAHAWVPAAGPLGNATLLDEMPCMEQKLCWYRLTLTCVCFRKQSSRGH
jgi:hypothetical protein